jgi:hypothetical protein
MQKNMPGLLGWLCLGFNFSALRLLPYRPLSVVVRVCLARKIEW